MYNGSVQHGLLLYVLKIYCLKIDKIGKNACSELKMLNNINATLHITDRE